MTSTLQITKLLKLKLEEYNTMPRKRSYSSAIAHIKDTMASLAISINILEQDIALITADADKYHEIKPLLDKLAPDSSIEPVIPGDQLPPKTTKTRHPRINKKEKNDNTKTPGTDDP